MVSKGERHQLQEAFPRGRREPETRSGRSTPIFKFLELAVKSYELEVRSCIGNWQRVVHPLSLITWMELSLELSKCQCTAFQGIVLLGWVSCQVCSATPPLYPLSVLGAQIPRPELQSLGLAL